MLKMKAAVTAKAEEPEVVAEAALMIEEMLETLVWMLLEKELNSEAALLMASLTSEEMLERTLESVTVTVVKRSKAVESWDRISPGWSARRLETNEAI